MTEARKVYPDCINTSNPYHECNDYCINKIAEAKKQKGKKGSGSIILDSYRSFGRRKPESKSQANPLQKLNSGSSLPSKDSIVLDANRKFRSRTMESKSQANHLKVLNNQSLPITGYPADTASPQSHLSSKIKAEFTDSEPQPSSEQCSKEISSREPSFRIEPIQTSDSESAPASPKEDVLQGTNTTGDTSDEEAQSVTSASDIRVRVGKYNVKASISSILQSIINKHGDIASTCPLESLSVRTYYIECVCFAVQELQSTPFSLLTKSKIKEISAILKDAESSQINVGWLLKEITEFMELITQQGAIEAAKIDCDQALESRKKELESQMKDLAKKERDVSDAKLRVSETKSQLKKPELESSHSNDNILAIHSKVEKLSQKIFVA